MTETDIHIVDYRVAVTILGAAVDFDGDKIYYCA